MFKKIRPKYNRRFKDELTLTWFKFGIYLGIVGLLAVILFMLKGNVIVSGPSTCTFNMVTGLYCPGCGATRAFNHFVHFHFLKSILFNPIVPYVIAAYVVFMTNTLFVLLTKKMGFAKYPVTMTIYIGVGILLGQWVVRNLLLIFWHITVL